MSLDRPQFVEYLWSIWSRDQRCTVEGDRATPFDTEDVIKLRRLLSHLPQSLGYAEDRSPIHSKIHNKLTGGAVKANREGVILCGPPASRKSNIADSIAVKLRARIIDSDLVKEMLPEFNGGKFAQMVHEESDVVRNSIFDECLDRGENIVMPIVGKSHGSVLKLFNLFFSEGYKVHLRLIKCDPKESAMRVVERFEKTGRFVDPAYALKASTDPERVFDDVSHVPWASRRMLSQDEIDAYLKEPGF